MIGFASWFVDNLPKRRGRLNQVWHDTEMVAGLSGKFIAVPAQRATQLDYIRLLKYLERYRAILDLGDKMGVTPILELWKAGVLNQSSDIMTIAIASGHSRISALLDFYHLYRRGSSFSSLRLISGKIFLVFHTNDYPELPPCTELRDSDRVFPGDGICPLNKVLLLLYNLGFRGGLFVELFNKGCWETADMREILRRSFEKTTQVINSPMG